MGKHAYLIMAHHRPDLLRELLDALDDDRNDIYIHVDKKSSERVWDYKTRNSKVVLVKPMSVNWGGYSQIECEYRLFKEAFSGGPYDYYHLMTGVTYPLKSQDYIHDFFDAHKGTEFVGFDNKEDYSFRARYYYLFSEAGKRVGLVNRAKWRLREYWLEIQKKHHYDRLKKAPFRNIEIKKGLAYVSVTNELVKYILDQKKVVKKLLGHSISGDEIFIQTLVYGSEFREKVYDYNNEFDGCMRIMAWDDVYGEREGHNYIMQDLDALMNSDKLFALKFEGKDGLDLIKELKKKNGTNNASIDNHTNL